MKIRTTLNWKSLKFQLSSAGFNKKQLDIIEEILKLHETEINKGEINNENKNN